MATASLQKNKGKQTHQNAFVDENKSEAIVIAGLAAEKHARKMAEHEQCMAELEIKKQRLALNAKGKHLEAEERRIAAQYADAPPPAAVSAGSIRKLWHLWRLWCQHHCTIWYETRWLGKPRTRCRWWSIQYGTP